MHICFLAASASIRSHPSMCSCMQGWRWAFPGLIRASRMFSVQGRWESAAHKYVRAVLSDGQFTGGDRWWSQHTLPTNMLSGCWFCLIGSFAAQIPTYLMLMMKSQESWRDSCKLNVCVCCLHSYASRNCCPSIWPALFQLRGREHTHPHIIQCTSILVRTW